jgi:hypothetical protein
VKHETPEWLPFAIVASLLIAVGAGIKSGWKLSGDEAKPPSTPQQAGVLNGWLGVTAPRA